MKNKTRSYILYFIYLFGPLVGWTQTIGLSPLNDSISLLCMERMTDKSSINDLVPQQPFYNRSIHFSTGYSLNNLRIDNAMRNFSDTSEHSFSVISHTPVFSLSQTFAIDSSFSIGYTCAFASSEIYFDNFKYGGYHAYFSINPQLHVFRSYRFEYYFKLKIGVSYDSNRLKDVPDERIQNIFPNGFKMFTGCAPVCISYLINENLSVQGEYAIWSSENFSFGIRYRWYKEDKK